MIHRAVNKDFDRIPVLNENLFNISMRKESKLGEQKDIAERVSFKEKSSEPHFHAFHQAP